MFCFGPNHFLLRPESLSASARITFCFGPNHFLLRPESLSVSDRIRLSNALRHTVATAITALLRSYFIVPELAFHLPFAGKL